MDNFEGKISSQIAWITAMAANVPYSMTGTVYPSGNLPANNIDKFTIDYYLFDKYANPIGNRSIWINTNLSGETTPTEHFSDTNGLIRFYYGPKISLLSANITAIAKDNASVSKNIIATFVNSAPTNMVIALTPQTMASRDVKPAEQAFVRATVFDNWGNPAPGEQVTFSLGTVNHGTYNQTAEPLLSSLTATTDKDGNAIVLFYPGSFTVNKSDPLYSSSATGYVDVTATWNTISNPVTATWKNYPYLSIDSFAEPPSVKLNETIDITINVTGNGYAMSGKPVTAILDMDCTSNMFQNPDQPPTYPHRIDSAKAAASVFVGCMTQGQDYIGLTSFGTEKNDKFHLPPQSNLGLVNTKVTALVKGTNAGDFGDSITESITNITETQPFRPQDEVRAVIVLRDAGGGNINGDMDALIAPALSANPKIYIFTVYYYDGHSTGSNAESIMIDLANKTGGKFFKPSTPDELQQAYRDIAGILRTLAGVNATMNLDFQNIEVNGTQMSGDQVFSYVPVELGMTDPGSRTTILWQNKSRSFLNQSDEWNANQQLRFNIGTINISETWSTTYRLKANQTGLINIFNCTLSGSSLSFNNGTENMCLPNLYITVTPNTTPLGLQSGLLSVTDLVPQSGNFTDSVQMQWNLNYTAFGNDTVTETYWYSFRNQPFIEFGSSPPLPSTNGMEVPRGRVLDVTKFPPGEYRIKVIATVSGIPPAEDSGYFTKPFEEGTVSIWLK
jgi:hypothetical protein